MFVLQKNEISKSLIYLKVTEDHGTRGPQEVDASTGNRIGDSGRAGPQQELRTAEARPRYI